MILSSFLPKDCQIVSVFAYVYQSKFRLEHMKEEKEAPCEPLPNIKKKKDILAEYE